MRPFGQPPDLVGNYINSPRPQGSYVLNHIDFESSAIQRALDLGQLDARSIGAEWKSNHGAHARLGARKLFSGVADPVRIDADGGKPQLPSFAARAGDVVC